MRVGCDVAENVRPSSDTDTVSKPAVAEPPEQSARDDVEAWRLDCLLRAGWQIPHAEVIAMLQDVDLHKACRMVQCGCPSELAFQILS